MAEEKKPHVTAQVLLAEIDKILENAEYYQSRESGKRFYKADLFPKLLGQYLVHSGVGIHANAKNFGMSRRTLDEILNSAPLSDNMLGRIRSAVAREVSAADKQTVFAGDWRKATTAEVEAAIADVSKRLVFLKKTVESSNLLNSPDSPIDPIQVKQLIALLAATVEALQAPFIDAKQTSGFFKWLSTLSKSAAEKGVEKALTDGMSGAATAGLQLIKRLLKMDGSGDLGNFS